MQGTRESGLQLRTLAERILTEFGEISVPSRDLQRFGAVERSLTQRLKRNPGLIRSYYVPVVGGTVIRISSSQSNPKQAEWIVIAESGSADRMVLTKGGEATIFSDGIRFSDLARADNPFPAAYGEIMRFVSIIQSNY